MVLLDLKFSCQSSLEFLTRFLWNVDFGCLNCVRDEGKNEVFIQKDFSIENDNGWKEKIEGWRRGEEEEGERALCDCSGFSGACIV